ncbi:hypothetical protein [Aureimonas sp. AU4]|uniref:hypothetical protein n=1 Tax=Aureimonas sp. AU4 TaxID=1638163 RepID=UPI000785FE5F|nr:hypothetical protein [Aureimonas sp. AU4]
MPYAENTSVSVEKTEAEIKATLRRYGADRFMTGEDRAGAVISFEMKDRRVTFRLPLPDRAEQRFKFDGRRNVRPVAKQTEAWEQACRSRWRALFLCIKAKLESVESGIETFEDAFLAQIVLPDGGTVADHILPRIADAYASGTMQPLLPPPRPLA